MQISVFVHRPRHGRRLEQGLMHGRGLNIGVKAQAPFIDAR
jgi:hypothetical protein